MFHRSIVLLALALTGCAAKVPPPAHVIPGSIPLDWRGPNGNSIIFDAPDGLIVVDTGRHPAHAEAIIDYARERQRPIAAIVNTHWHLDHTTGNLDLRQAYPGAQIYATTAIEGALRSFLGRNRAQADQTLVDPKVPPEQKAQILRGRSRVDHPETLRPTLPVTRSGRMGIAGREFDVHVAPFAATEADLWLYDPKTREAVVGDLVVDIVPFMDTACTDGWLSALREIDAVPFTTLIPGHGPVMDRAAFRTWKIAVEHFVECGRSTVEPQKCVDGWERDASRFIDEPHRQYVREAADYYLTTRLRSSPDEQQRYCKPL